MSASVNASKSYLEGKTFVFQHGSKSDLVKIEEGKIYKAVGTEFVPTKFVGVSWDKLKTVYVDYFASLINETPVPEVVEAPAPSTKFVADPSSPFTAEKIPYRVTSQQRKDILQVAEVMKTINPENPGIQVVEKLQSHWDVVKSNGVLIDYLTLDEVNLLDSMFKSQLDYADEYKVLKNLIAKNQWVFDTLAGL